MRALVGFLMLGVMTLIACNKDGGGGGGNNGGTPGGFAGTPQPCSIQNYTGNVCNQAVGPGLVMPGSWPLSTGFSFPNPWRADLYRCGCPRVAVAVPGQPAYQQEQVGVFFPASNTVACSPLGYFRDGNHSYVGNINVVLRAFAQININPGAGAGVYGGVSPYGNFGFGANFGGPVYSNFRDMNINQAYGYGLNQQMAVSDPAARACLDRMIIGCDLALEEALNAQGQSQCGIFGGPNRCVPVVRSQLGQTPTTLGKCANTMMMDLGI